MGSWEALWEGEYFAGYMPFTKLDIAKVHYYLMMSSSRIEIRWSATELSPWIVRNSRLDLSTTPKTNSSNLPTVYRNIRRVTNPKYALTSSLYALPTSRDAVPESRRSLSYVILIPFSSISHAQFRLRFPEIESWLIVQIPAEPMSLDDKLSSPHRRSQTVFSVSPSYKKLYARGDELGSSWLAMLQRHRFLLTSMGLLAILCTIYLYFAITLGESSSCFGLKGTEKAACLLKSGGAALAKGKLKI
nr:uncharacterized protein LOC111365571 [Ipomoea batatas]GMD37364.1 uncharacterized protein LOC111365571 [Ipomoea batatas]